MKRVSLIGRGRIGAPVLTHLGRATGWRLARVLARTPGAGITVDEDEFFAEPVDLIVDAAGPAALAEHGERALAHADLWSVGAAALADDALRARLEATGRRHGHRLRLLPGSIAGLDGVAAAAVDPAMRLTVRATRPGAAASPGRLFAGPVRAALARFPHELNIAAAAALAGPGLDAAEVELTSAAAGEAHVLGVTAESRYGRFNADWALTVDAAAGIHPVAACIIAALERELRTIWVG